jgi:purine-binding chemotaxis protein CheW
MITHAKADQVVVLAIDDVRFALRLDTVRRVVRAVEVTALPDAPSGVLGAINVHGRIVPVFDVRPRFGLPSRAVRASDHMVLAEVAGHEVAVLVDAVDDVLPAERVATSGMEALVGMETVEGMLMRDDMIVPIQDLARFLPEVTTKGSVLKLAA